MGMKKIADRLAEHDTNILSRMDEMRYAEIVWNIKFGDKVLDVGCENGMLKNYLPALTEYYGVDISKKRVDMARQQMRGNYVRLLPDPKVKCYDINKGLPFKSNFFDVVVLGEIMEHVASPFNLLKECRRVLKKDGKVIITTPNSRRFMSVFASLFNIRQHNMSLHINSFSKYELENLLKMNGFVPIVMKTLYLRPFPKSQTNIELLLNLFPQLGDTLFSVAFKSKIDEDDIYRRAF